MNKNVKMTCSEFADKLDNEYFFQELVENHFWENNSFASKPYLNLLKTEAAKRNIELTDLEEFDDDKYFHNLYDSTEKGLS